MFARFNENPAMTLQDIKETKRYGRTDGQTDGRMDARTDNVKTVYPLQTKFAGGIKILYQIPVFQDQGQIQGLFQVCANPDEISVAHKGLLLKNKDFSLQILHLSYY